eukprot:7646224-Pyramimonas_sp.AAC.1
MTAHDHSAPMSKTFAHAGHMPRTHPHNERICQANIARTCPKTPLLPRALYTEVPSEHSISRSNHPPSK